jgi:hypothetical protein
VQTSIQVTPPFNLWPTTAERRREARFNTRCDARIRVLNPLTTTLIDVTIVNASRGGVRVAVPVSLDIGSILQVTFDGSSLIAEVRNCVPTGDGFTAGLRVSAFYDRDVRKTHASATRVREIVQRRSPDSSRVW